MGMAIPVFGVKTTCGRNLSQKTEILSPGSRDGRSNSFIIVREVRDKSVVENGLGKPRKHLRR